MLEEMDRSGVPDIALLDISVCQAFSAPKSREIRSKRDTTGYRFLLTTSSDFAVEALSHANDYLTKPLQKRD